MQIPPLPTDNLYKFLAISGLIIIVLSIVYPLSKSKELAIKRFDLITKMDIRNIELKTFVQELRAFVEESRASVEESETFSEELKPLNKEMEALIKEYHKAGKINGKDILDKRFRAINEKNRQIDMKKQQIDMKKQQIKTKEGQIDTKNKELDIAKAELEGEKRQITYLDENLIFYTKAALNGLVFGVFVAIIGFVLWYRRVQRYQDAILKEQHKEATKK